MYRYKIGDIQFLWDESGIPLFKDKFTNLFVMSETDRELQGSAVTFKSEFADLDVLRKSKLIYHDGTFERYSTMRGQMMIFHWSTCRFAYGFFLDDLKMENMITCYFHSDMKYQIPLLSVSRFFSTVGMHSKLLQHDALILHASFIDWNGKAILFTAPSGTGKSTQADLWAKYEEAEIINGDRALLRKKNGTWHSYGYPCCGSSNICVNRTLPIAAIVVLEQNNENRVTEMSIGQKVRALISGAEVYTWDMEEIDRAICIAMQIVQEVPVFTFRCRPDQDAVDVLKHYLEEQ